MASQENIENLQNEIRLLQIECNALKNSESKHQEAQRQALQQVREATWNLANTAAVHEILPIVQAALKLVKIPIMNCGLNLIDIQDPPMVHTYVYKAKDKDKAEYKGTCSLNDVQSFADTTAQIWRSGKPFLRRDLNPYQNNNESNQLQRIFGPARSMLEIPFERGTFVLTNTQPDAFTERDFSFLLMLGDVVSDGLRRQEAVEDLGRSESRYQQLVETPNIVVILIDPVGEYIYFSPQIQQWTGHAPANFYADPSLGRQIFYPEDRQRLDTAIQQTLQGEIPPDLECRWYRYNGKNLWVMLSFFPIYETPEAQYLNKVDLIQITVQDITSRKEAEAVLKRDSEALQRIVDERTSTLNQTIQALQKAVSERQRIQTANSQLEKALQQAQKLQAVGQLTAGIAHNFNNMLMVILGNIDIVLRTADEQTHSALQDAQSTSLKAAEMVKQLLTFSRHGEIAAQEALNTKAIIDNITEICRKTFDRRFTIESHIDPQLPMIMGDASQLEQVFLNLCLNSRDALEENTPKKPCITLTATLIKELTHDQIPHQEAPPGSYVRIEVIDNGAGIDDATQERIFEPFFTTKESGKGTGLGLATTYAIINQHLGWLEVESQPNQGTAIAVYLPASPRTKSQAPPITTPQVVGGTETVLLIDDEEEIRKLAALSLRSHGYKVLLGCNGADGLAQFMRHQDKISLVLLDLLMPELSGKATLNHLLAIDPNLKVIISTGLTNGTSQAPGAKAVLHKPYQEHTMLEKVRQVLDA